MYIITLINLYLICQYETSSKELTIKIYHSHFIYGIHKRHNTISWFIKKNRVIGSNKIRGRLNPYDHDNIPVQNPCPSTGLCTASVNTFSRHHMQSLGCNFEDHQPRHLQQKYKIYSFSAT